MPQATKRSRNVLLMALALCLAVVACDYRRWPQETVASATRPAAAGATRVVAAGDIACDPTLAAFNGGAGTRSACAMSRTGSLIETLSPDVVLALGDLQYDVGGGAAIAASYGPSWGRFKTRTRPAIGNHDYLTADGNPFWAYWGSQAGTPGQGWYSFEAGVWHVVVLNSNCDRVDCSNTGAQAAWLRSDLAAHPNTCALATWHHPRFSSGTHGANPALQPLWAILANGGVDVVLNGHDHNYERLARVNANSERSATGIQSFVVGTGGVDLRSSGAIDPRSIVYFSAFGVLQLDLSASSYYWRFVGLDSAAGVGDFGSGTCV